MSTCYDTFLLNRYEEAEEKADAREEAIDAVRARIHAELVSEFLRGLAGETVELNHIEIRADCTCYVASQPFPNALHDVIDNMHVMGLHIAMMQAKTPDEALAARDAYRAAAAECYANDHAEVLAEFEVNGSRA